MRKPQNTTCVIIFCALVCQLHVSVEGCFSFSSKSSYFRGGKPFKSNRGGGSSVYQRRLGKNYDLLTQGNNQASKSNEMYFISPPIFIKKDIPIYGRIEVPYHMSGGYSMTITVRYKKFVISTPLWVHLKWNEYPTSTYHDKSGATFVSRRYNRIRQDNPKSGSYYLMIEPLKDARITISISILPIDHPGAGKSEWSPFIKAPPSPTFKRTYDVAPNLYNTPRR